MYDKYITRDVYGLISDFLFQGKTIVIYGARQVGKTTLLKQFAGSYPEKTTWLNMDLNHDRELLNNLDGQRAADLFDTGGLLLIDEAQRLDSTGLTLKVLHEYCPNTQIIATGSSAFELTDRIKESLTGRKRTIKLFPLSQNEIINHFGKLEYHRSLETRISYGNYPEVVMNPGKEEGILSELISDYLYKDVFMLKDIRKPETLEKLVYALAYQMGSQVSFRELGQLIQTDKETVERYIRLLEEAFIIFRLPSFSRNVRNELKRSRKIYFYDTGIRNALINRFGELELREDRGALWENFMIAERIKKRLNTNERANFYFWRTNVGQEIDLIEEKEGKLFAFEFKWASKEKMMFPKTFTKNYPQAQLQLISKENFIDFM